MPKAAKSFVVWLILAALFVAIDQVSKGYIQSHFAYLERLPVLPFLDLILVYNTGAAFSLGADGSGWQRWLLSALALLASIFILYLLRKNKENTFLCVALTLILSGALGNLIDRIIHGHVIDFLLFYWDSWQFYFPAFNMADTFITIGAILMIIGEFFLPKSKGLS